MTVGKDSSVFWTLLCLCPTPCCVRILLHWWRKKLICEDLFSITEPKFSFLKNIQACLDSGFGSLQSWSTETPWKLIWPCALSPSQLCKAHYSVPNLHLFSHSRGSKDARFPFLSRTGRVHPSPDKNRTHLPRGMCSISFFSTFLKSYLGPLVFCTVTLKTFNQSRILHGKVKELLGITMG